MAVVRRPEGDDRPLERRQRQRDALDGDQWLDGVPGRVRRCGRRKRRGEQTLLDWQGRELGLDADLVPGQAKLDRIGPEHWDERLLLE